MTLLEILNKNKYKTDKHTNHHYIQNFYDKEFSVYKDREINLLEIGVWNGESMKLWSDYFTSAKMLVGVDTFERVPIDKVMKQLNGYNTGLHKLDSVNCSDTELQEFKDLYHNDWLDGFDIIIDDGLHTTDAQIKTFNNFSSLMKEGGLYIIEDIPGGHSVDVPEKESDKDSINEIKNNIPNVEIGISNGNRWKNQPYGIVRF